MYEPAADRCLDGFISVDKRSSRTNLIDLRRLSMFLRKVSHTQTPQVLAKVQREANGATDIASDVASLALSRQAPQNQQAAGQAEHCEPEPGSRARTVTSLGWLVTLQNWWRAVLRLYPSRCEIWRRTDDQGRRQCLLVICAGISRRACMSPLWMAAKARSVSVHLEIRQFC